MQWIATRALLSVYVAAATTSLPDPDLAFPGSFERWFGETLSTADKAELHIEGVIPAWLHGDLINAGPSQQRLGHEEFMHVFDGYARINRFTINASAGSITFSSRMLDSEWYRRSIKAGHVTPATLMAETQPPRPFSKIPLVNALAPNDNVYVMPWRIGDEMLYMTDGETRLKFDRNTLDVLEEITPKSYTGDALPEGYMCPAGSAHVLPDPQSAPGSIGGFLGVMGCQPQPPRTGANLMILYRVAPGDIKRRIKVAQVEVKSFSYMHSFSITKHYAILIGEPYYINGQAIAMGKPVSQAFWYNVSEATTFHIIDLKTGEIQSIGAQGFLFIHTCNSYELDSDTIVMEVSGVSEQGFLQQGMKSLILNKTARDTHKGFQAKLMRYTLHRHKGIVDVEELKHTGTMGLPRFNEAMRGEKTCFVYGQVSHYNSSAYASTATVKLDTCRHTEVGNFYKLAHIPGEAMFISRPGGVEEDDGVLVGTVYDGPSQQSYLNILDARSMHQIAKAYLPFFLPFPLHSNFFQY